MCSGRALCFLTSAFQHVRALFKALGELYRRVRGLLRSDWLGDRFKADVIHVKPTPSLYPSCARMHAGIDAQRLESMEKRLKACVMHVKPTLSLSKHTHACRYRCARQACSGLRSKYFSKCTGSVQARKNWTHARRYRSAAPRVDGRSTKGRRYLCKPHPISIQAHTCTQVSMRKADVLCVSQQMFLASKFDVLALFKALKDWTHARRY